MGFLESDNVSTKLDRCTLHSEADSKEGDVSLASISDGLDFPFDSAFAEAARDENAVVPGE